MVSIKLSENNGQAPEAVPYMPAGLNHICCTVNGRAAKRTVMVDAETCERLNADLQEKLQASKGGEKARPVVLFDHKAGAAAAVPQAVANIERAQFWSQVMQIPGMSVVKSEVYDSLGIAMPGKGDEVLEAPSHEQDAQGGLEALLQGMGKGDTRKRDEVAVAARAQQSTDGLDRALPAWLEPIINLDLFNWT